MNNESKESKKRSMKYWAIMMNELALLKWGLVGFIITIVYWDGFSDPWQYPKVLLLLGVLICIILSWIFTSLFQNRIQRIHFPVVLISGAILFCVQYILFAMRTSWQIPPVGLLLFMGWILFITIFSLFPSGRRLRLLYWGIEVGVTLSALYTLIFALGGAPFITPIFTLIGGNQLPETLVGPTLNDQVLCSAVILVSSVAQMMYTLYDKHLSKRLKPLTVLYYLGLSVVNGSFLLAFWGQEGVIIPSVSVSLTLGLLLILYLKPGLVLKKKRLRFAGVFILVLISVFMSLVLLSNGRSVLVAQDSRLMQEVVPAVLVLTQDTLVFGVGLGQGNRNLEFISQGSVVEISNSYIQWFVETGFLGLIMMLLFVGWFLRVFFRSYYNQTLYRDPFYIVSMLGLFQLSIIGIFHSYSTTLIFLGAVYCARIMYYVYQDNSGIKIRFSDLNAMTKGVIGSILIIGVALSVWGSGVLVKTAYSDILWNNQSIRSASAGANVTELEEILDYNPRHISASKEYVRLLLNNLKEFDDDPVALEQTTIDIIRVTQNLVTAFPQWYAVQLFEAQVLIEISETVLLPNSLFEDRLRSLQMLAPESAHTLVTEAQFLLIQLNASIQNSQLQRRLGTIIEDDQVLEEVNDVQSDKIRDLLDRAFEKNPSLPDIWTTRILYSELFESSVDRLSILEEYVLVLSKEQLPADPGLVLLLVQEYMDRDRFDEANKYLQQVKQAYPDLEPVQILQEVFEEKSSLID